MSHTAVPRRTPPAKNGLSKKSPTKEVSTKRSSSKDLSPQDLGVKEAAGGPSNGLQKGSSTGTTVCSPGRLGHNAAVQDAGPVQARPGDHHMIHHLLVSVLHQPSMTEFQAALEDPFYEPSDRLLIKRAQQIVAHTHLLKRQLHFGPCRLPTTIISDLAVAPEFRGQECGTRLMQAAAERMLEDGSALGMLRTRSPEFFLSCGWSVCLRHSFSIADARRILSHLREHEPRHDDPLKPEHPPLNIRIWRHVEQAALVRLYEAATENVFGPLFRSEAYWRWLISRRAYDRIYVAINGPDKIKLDDSCEPIVGYAVMRQGRILELVTHPE